MALDPTLRQNVTNSTVTVNVKEVPVQPVLETTSELVGHKETQPDLDVIQQDTGSLVVPVSETLQEWYARLDNECTGLQLGGYEIISRLGKGTMGSVFHARHLSEQKEVALKVLSLRYAQDQAIISRFKREANVLSKLHHTNIVRCFGMGKIHGLRFLVMEYVNGGTLKQLLKTRERLSVEDALCIILDVAHALKYAHDHQVIHRDIKPDNVLIGHDGVVKLADLGLAKPVDDNLSLTMSGIGIGTPMYMPPEQMRSAKSVDARSDIYALGVMLYVMLCKHKPFKSKDFAGLLQEKQSGYMASMRQYNRHVPEKLELIIAKMMDRSPVNRYQSCEEVLAALEQLDLAGPFLSEQVTGINQVVPTPRKSQPVVNLSMSSTSYPDQVILPVSESKWYVQVKKDGKGPTKLVELTTEQLRVQIETRKIDPTALASHQPNERFRPIAEYPQWESVLRSVLVQVRAERRSAKLQKQFEKISDEVDAYERRRWWSDLFLTFGGWVKLIVLLMAVAALGYVLIRFLPPLIELLGRKLGIFS